MRDLIEGQHVHAGVFALVNTVFFTVFDSIGPDMVRLGFAVATAIASGFFYQVGRKAWAKLTEPKKK